MELPSAARLTFREMSDADLDDMAALLGDKDVMRFYPRPRTRGEASQWITRNQQRYRDHGFGLWIVSVRETGEFVGDCVRASMQGQGYGTEAAAASRDFARDVLKASRLIAIINPANVPSQRVATKIGLTVEKRATAPNGAEAVIYAARL